MCITRHKIYIAVFVIIISAAICLLNRYILLEGPPFGSRVFISPHSAVLDGKNNIYVIDDGFRRITCLDSRGRIRWTREKADGAVDTRIYNAAANSGADGGIYLYETEFEPFRSLPLRDVIRKYDSAGNYQEDCVTLGYDNNRTALSAVPRVSSFNIKDKYIYWTITEEFVLKIYRYNIDSKQLSMMPFNLSEGDFSAAGAAVRDFNHFIWTEKSGRVRESKNKEVITRAMFSWSPAENTTKKNGIIPWGVFFADDSTELEDIIFFDAVSQMPLRLKNDGTILEVIPVKYFNELRAAHPLSPAGGAVCGFGVENNSYSGIYNGIVWFYDGTSFFSFASGARLNNFTRVKILAVDIAAAAGGAALIFIIIVFFRVDFIKRRMLFIKQIVFVLPAFIISYLLLFLVLNGHFSVHLENWLEDDMVSLASINSKLINGDDIKSINSTNDFSGEAYMRIKNSLLKIVQDGSASWHSRYYASVYKIIPDIFGNYELYMIAHTNNSHQPLRQAKTLNKDSGEWRLITNGKTASGERINDGETYIWTAAPVFDERLKLCGILETGFAGAQIAAENRDVVRSTIFIVTLICLCFGLMLCVFMFSITRRLGAVSNVLKEISHGNYSARVTIHANDELGNVGVGLNQMADILQAKLCVEEANRTKSMFLSNMNHEIRTPMNAVIGLSEMMPTDNLTDLQNEYILNIRKMARTLFGIINDILDFSKIEAGKMAFFPVHFSIVELYYELCSMFIFYTAEKGIEFRHKRDHAIPEIIYGDEIRIKQILTNIINNAVKYTREGFVELSFTREVKIDMKEYIVVTVRDSGIGIKENEMGSLFGVFERAGINEPHKVSGMGLGLPIARQLLDLMGGSIEAESVYKSGSKFTVYIPLVPGDKSKVKNENTQGVFWVRRGEAEINILVVDDSQVNLTVAKSYLANHNMSCDAVLSGEEAIEAVKQKQYDIVFMDHMMPGIDGVEATKQIRALGKTGVNLSAEMSAYLRTMPIVTLTANTVVEMRDAFLNAGMTDFISKPIDAIHFNAVLGKYIRRDKIESGKPAVQQKVRTKISRGISRLLGVNVEINSHESVWTKSQRTIFRELAALTGLDANEGLHHTAGNIDDYFAVMRQFCAGIDEASRTIETALEKKDWKEYALRTHAYKGSLAIIGQEELSLKAKELEFASKSIINDEQNAAQSIELCAEKTAPFIAQLREFKTMIQNTQLFPRETAQKTWIEKEALTEKLNTLAEACEAFKPDDASAVAGELDVSTYNAEADPLIEEICALVRAFRFSEVGSKIEALRVKI